MYSPGSEDMRTPASGNWGPIIAVGQLNPDNDEQLGIDFAGVGDLVGRKDDPLTITGGSLDFDVYLLTIAFAPQVEGLHSTDVRDAPSRGLVVADRQTDSMSLDSHTCLVRDQEALADRSRATGCRCHYGFDCLLVGIGSLSLKKSFQRLKIEWRVIEEDPQPSTTSTGSAALVDILTDSPGVTAYLFSEPVEIGHGSQG